MQNFTDGTKTKQNEKLRCGCMIKIFDGQGWRHLQDLLPLTNNFYLYPPPILRCFEKDSLTTPIPRHSTSSIFHCYPLPIHHPFPNKVMVKRRYPSKHMFYFGSKKFSKLFECNSYLRCISLSKQLYNFLSPLL